jgi:uncharacterized membrane protein
VVKSLLPALFLANSAFKVPTLEWMSRFHVVVVHFPIALLLTAALAEAMVMWRGAPELNPVTRFCVRLGAAGAIAAAALGWTRASYSGDTSAVLALHRWAGTAACICSIAAAILTFQWRPPHPWLFRASLFSSAALVGLAGHLGGLTVYGESYFRW